MYRCSPRPRRRNSNPSAMNVQASKRYNSRIDKYKKTLKELIRKNKVSVIPAGLQMVEGKSQRVVLVDRGNVEELFTKSMKPLSRKASSKKKQK